jgi:DNA-binding NarL/FixJ family response regulator
MESGQARPDAVVADVRMPELDGVALLRRIKAQFPSIPVVLVSAFADEAAWRDGLEAGAADVFPKPIHGASLVRALREVMGGGRSHGLPMDGNPGPHGVGITSWRRD